MTVTEPEPEEYELYDLTLDPTEERNLAHPSFADDRSRDLQRKMLGLLIEQLDAKRLIPSAGEKPGYRPPEDSVDPPVTIDRSRTGLINRKRDEVGSEAGRVIEAKSPASSCGIPVG